MNCFKPDAECLNNIRLAFAEAHANELWQADTLCGPYVQINGMLHRRRIAFWDDASRVSCHGQFFPAENVDRLIEAPFTSAAYRRASGKRRPGGFTWRYRPQSVLHWSAKSVSHHFRAAARQEVSSLILHQPFLFYR